MSKAGIAFGAAALAILANCAPAPVSVSETNNGNIVRGQVNGNLNCDVRTTSTATSRGQVSGPTTGTSRVTCESVDPIEQFENTADAVIRGAVAVGATALAVDKVVDTFDRLF